MRKIGFFEKIYPVRIDDENRIYYYEDGLFFTFRGNYTNIPRRLQRHFMVPATNPDMAGRYTSVRSCIFFAEHLGLFTFGI